ncbi:boron transporter 4-like [Diospyros lotus]|uniref:boron transporter 4-like n=1 Tax=Diospyros lotus TaxID=55363 RepID=UPI0022576716|nr:boron transporter 4-like [Diospyros lotus]
MPNIKAPFSGIIKDFKGRKACYKQDWTDATNLGTRILAPNAYIFFASALPVIAFGEQLHSQADGHLSTVETLAYTAICGIIHSIFGDQPLLILGVAEPTVIMYTYLYNFAKNKADLGRRLYLAWVGWKSTSPYFQAVCVWTALLLFLLAVSNACNIVNRFTRITGELFGILIAVFFTQQAIEGMASEFGVPKDEDPTLEKYNFQWLYDNGLLAIIFSFGILFTALASRRARSWKYGTGWLRAMIADFGVPLMVLAWSALSFSVPKKIPSGIPRRLVTPLLWESASPSWHHWMVIKDMGKVPAVYIFAAIVPALMIASLYFFDHSVASQMAQQKEFNLKKPSSYHYDILLLGAMADNCSDELRDSTYETPSYLKRLDHEPDSWLNA